MYISLDIMNSVEVQPGGPPRGLGDLGRMAIYFQGSREHW